MARATKEDSELTANRIRETAREMFAAQGYAEVQLEEVATRAGYTRGALYHHYAGKKALFAAVLEDIHAEVEVAVVAAADEHAEPWEQLEAGCLAFLRASTRPDIARLLLVEGPAVVGWEAWRAHDSHHSYRQLEEVLGELEATGEIRPGAAEPAAPLLSGAMNEAALWLASTARPDAEAGVEETLLVMLRALRNS